MSNNSHYPTGTLTGSFVSANANNNNNDKYNYEKRIDATIS